MGMLIKRTKDPQLLAQLNRDVQQLHYEIEPEIFKPYSEKNMINLFERILEVKEASAYVAYINKVPLGYLILKEECIPEDVFRNRYRVLNIEQICVDGENKGGGIGKALVNYAKEYAKEHKIQRIEMNYWTKNKNSGEFFRSQGFANYNEKLFVKVD